MQFLILLHGCRPSLLTDMTADEGTAVGQHFAYLQKALNEGKLFMAGRREDKPYGIAVIEAASEGDARQFLDKDPAIQKGVFTGEVHPFRLALLAGK